MNEKEAIQYAKELGMLKFSYMADRSVTYETIKPKLINGEYCHLAVEFYIKDEKSPVVFSYDCIEEMNKNDFQLASINQMNTETIMESLYFSKYVCK